MIGPPASAARARSWTASIVPWKQCVAFLFVGVLAGAGCSASQKVHENVVTVDGIVTARGNEPFVRYVLETSEGNLYALRIPEDKQAEFQTPAQLRVTGRLYVADWHGRPFAHLDVTEWTQLN